MTIDSDLPEAVRAAVGRWVDTLDALEVLLFLQRGRDRSWTATQICAALGIAEKAAGRELGKLVGRGLATATADAYRFAPSVADAEEGVALIAAAYRERRIELINHVASDALRRIRDLADAFRIGKGKKEG
jgi:hypothetical protein